MFTCRVSSARAGIQRVLQQAGGTHTVVKALEIHRLEGRMPSEQTPHVLGQDPDAHKNEEETEPPAQGGV